MNLNHDIAERENSNKSNTECHSVLAIDLTEEPPPNLSMALNENEEIVELDTECFVELFGKLSKKHLNTIGQACEELQNIIDCMNVSEAAAAATEISQSQVKTVYLRVNLLHHLFKWLPLKILYTLSRKCDKLHAVAGEYFRNNFSATIITGETDGIYVHGVSFNNFSEFVEKIMVSNADLSTFKYFRRDNFNSLKQLNLCNIKITAATIENTKDILNNVECLELIDSRVQGDFGKLMKICPKLKRLNLRNRNSNIVAGTSNQWLLKPHYGLKHFKLIHKDRAKIEEIKTFFMRNRNISSYGSSANCLWEIRHSLIEARPKFDLLQIDIDIWAKRNMGTFSKLLHELYENVVFKRLHLSTKYVNSNSIKHLAKLEYLERLIVVNCDKRDIVLHPLVNLKELSISVSCHVSNLVVLATQLTKLERIFFYQAVADDILNLLKYSRSLKEIIVSKLPYGIHFTKGILDVIALNEERERLQGAQKTIIYVDENIYLRTKWNFSQLDYSLIEVKRLDEWPDPF